MQQFPLQWSFVEKYFLVKHTALTRDITVGHECCAAELPNKNVIFMDIRLHRPGFVCMYTFGRRAQFGPGEACVLNVS